MSFFSGLLMMIALAGCSKTPEPPEDIRPVRALLLAPADNLAELELAGEVVPRYESKMGFRVGGKIIDRKVEVGGRVRRGQLLMQLDAADLQLSQAQAQAQLAAAESALALARAERDRHRELRTKNFVSQAVLDAKEAGYQSALSAQEQAQAALKAQSNQRSYANLLADTDGIVTGIEAEAGQVVAAGMPVVRVAREGSAEVRVSLPEDKLDALRQAKAIEVRTWANTGRVIVGKLRELSPVADPATRTFTAKISLPATAADVRFGMSATVKLVLPAPDAIRLPLSALFEEGDESSVWLVREGRVGRVPVRLAGAVGNEILVASGLSAGDTVVTAGANLLREGQKVTILGEAPARPQADGTGAAQ